MGKNFCKIEKKWCKHCKHQACHWDNANVLLHDVHRCPKRESTRTVRLKDYIAHVNFEDLMSAMLKWHTEENKNREGYKEVLSVLQNMPARKNDWFIKVDTIHEEERECFGTIIPAITYLTCHGVAPNKKVWSISFTPWTEWLGMNIHPDTLANLSKDEIIAEILWDMTYNGFTEKRIDEERKKIISSFEEAKSENDE